MKAYTINQVAKEYSDIIGKTKTIRRLVESGKLPAINLNKRGKYKKWIIKQESIESFLLGK